MKSVCYIVSSNGACDYYRAELPWRTAKANGIDVRRVSRGDHPDKMAHALDADVILFQRADNEPTLEAMATLKRKGKKVVVDFDDNLFHVSPFSPHYEDFGIADVTVDLKGEKVKLWEDGKNGFNAVANAHRVECVKAACALADVVTVTTGILADAYREFNGNIVPLPNCCDPSLWQRLPLKRSDEVRIYWSGGASHFEDFAMIADPLKEVLARHKNAKLVIMGQHFQGTTQDIDPRQVELHRWVDVAAYPYKTAILNPTIAIIPLVDNEFNACKSSIKLTEQSFLGTSSVASYVSPYREDYNGSNAVFIEGNTPQGWFQGIDKLVTDSLLREAMGEEAKKAALAKYDINNNWQKWVTAYGLDS